MSRKKAEKEEKKKKIEKIRTKFINEDFSEAELKYQAIVAYCEHFNTTFHDGEFPHKSINCLQKGLLAKLKSYIYVKLEWEDKIDWFRPVDYLQLVDVIPANPGARVMVPSIQWSVLTDPKAFHVFQSETPDCCLVAVLSVIAESSAVLNRMFPRKEVSEYGVYEVRLCLAGEWKSVIVDDWFLGFDKRLISVRTNQNQLWPLLIEKAIAKVYGGYDKLQGILSEQCFGLVTGFPVRNYDFHDFSRDEIWDLVYEARKSQDFVTTGTCTQREVPLQLGLPRNHGFSVIDVREYRGNRLICLRNPWGRSTWNGKWGPLWNGWTPQMKLDLEVPLIDRGQFWMDFDDFFKYFYNVVICRNRPDWYTIRVKTVVGGRMDKSHKAIRITVHEKCQVCVSAFCAVPAERDSSLVCIRQFCETGKEGPVVNVSYVSYKVSSADVWLEPGSYLVMVTKLYTQKDERNIVIHSSKPLDAHLIPLNPTVMVDCIQKFIQKYGKDVKLTTPSASIRKFWFTSDVMIILAQNRSINQYFHVNVYFDRHKFEYYSTRSIRQTRQEDTIPPMSRQIILILKRRKWKKIDLKIDLEYSMSSEEYGKYGRRNGKAHDPEIHNLDYIHHVLSIDDDENQ